MPLFRVRDRTVLVIGAVLSALCLTVIGLLCAIGISDGAFCIAVFAGFLFLLAVAVWVMAVLLYRSVRVTLYAYRNISLIGGLLFCVLLAAVFAVSGAALLIGSDLSLSHLFRLLLNFPRQFAFYAALVLLAVSVSLGVSNLALIRHEGFRPTNALSLLFAAFYLGGTAAVFFFNDVLTERVLLVLGLSGHPLAAVISTVIALFLLLMLCYFECILVGSAVLGWWAVRRRPAHDKDFIIILGCSIDRRGGLLPLLRGRVNSAIRFAWEQEIACGKPARYIPSGGQGPNEIMSEGSAMELYLKTRGAEDNEVFPERRSANTEENFRFSREIAESLLPGAKVAFATTNYHVLRSGILARRAGLDAEGIAGDTKWYFWPNGFIREFFGILALNRRAHGIAACWMAVFCAVLGVIGCAAGLL